MLVSSRLPLPDWLQDMRKLKVYDITQDPNQFIKVTRLPAAPFMLMGNICTNKTSVIMTAMFVS